jgi:hypothetical protein
MAKKRPMRGEIAALSLAYYNTARPKRLRGIKKHLKKS